MTLKEGDFKVGTRIKWQDLVSGRTRYGVLHESNVVLAESQPLKDKYDDFTLYDVERVEWTVVEDKTNKKFSLNVGELEVIKFN